LGTPTTSGVGVGAAQASVALAVTLDELVDHADLAVVALATERRSEWAEIAGSRRIVTYTRFEVEQAVVGAAPAELWVRTLGGVVGHIGQRVEGEAELGVGSRAMLFLTRAPDDALVVTARAQGHFPIVTGEASKRRLARSPNPGAVLTRKKPLVAAEQLLVGRDLDEAIQTVRASRSRRHAGR